MLLDEHACNMQHACCTGVQPKQDGLAINGSKEHCAPFDVGKFMHEFLCVCVCTHVRKSVCER